MTSSSRASDIERALAPLAATGANLTLELPEKGTGRIRIGQRPETTRVVLRCPEAVAAVRRGDLLALAEHYLAGHIDIDGSPAEIMRLTDLFDMGGGRLAQWAFQLRLGLPGRRRLNRQGIAFHYDQPPEFFLGWLERWRSYSHGFYREPHDTAEDAQARKMQHAIDALGLEAGMDVFDMGCGWGCFVEYAGLLGIRVHGITLSRVQHDFVARLITEQHLPCTVELVDFLDYRPARLFDGAVFMGSLEHMPDYQRVATFASRYLTRRACIYADFLAHPTSRTFGTFMRKNLWPGTSAYVNVARLIAVLTTSGFNIHQLVDDTRSYALTVHDWAAALEARRAELARRFGERTVRTFLLFLWGSHHFFTTNRTQAYHLVAGREPARFSSDDPSARGGVQR
jgi:cyclopropane-fatty-acyl-phospholipid synthase